MLRMKLHRLVDKPPKKIRGGNDTPSRRQVAFLNKSGVVLQIYRDAPGYVHGFF